MTTTPAALLAALRREMVAVADETKAPSMVAYMKSAMPYHGVSHPRLSAICKKVFAEQAPSGCAEWKAAVLYVWRHAKYREERYAAVALASSGAHRDCLTPEVIPMLEEMIVSGAWWDYVDELSQLVGAVLRSHPDRMQPLMRAWSTDPDMWKRRASIICQLRFKRDTDLRLLYANIEANTADREFFIRKAIGWALRQYAWTDHAEVASYVKAHEAELSGLSRREALKNMARLTGAKAAGGARKTR